MAVFRIEKTKNYTTMSNHHLRNNNLSLKAKGLLSQMLSLPEEWDYTLIGLSLINREKVDAIRTAVKELESAGYITRSRERKGNGRLGGTDYIIHEQPVKPENPELEKPILENPTQINKDISKKDKENKDLINIPSLPITSALENYNMAKDYGAEEKEINAFQVYREIICDNIDYSIMLERYPYEKERLDEIVDLMLETVCSSRKTIRIASDDYPADLVKNKFMKLNHMHIEFIMDCLSKNTTEIRNIKKYLLASLFNSLSTKDNYFSTLIARDTAR